MNDWNGIKGNIRRNIREKGTDHTQQKIVVSFPFLFQEIYIYYIYRIVGWFKDSWGTHCSFIQRQKRISDLLVRNMIVKMTSLIFTVYVLMGKENIFLQTRGQENVSKKIVRIIATKNFHLNFLQLIIN